MMPKIYKSESLDQNNNVQWKCFKVICYGSFKKFKNIRNEHIYLYIYIFWILHPFNEVVFLNKMFSYLSKNSSTAHHIKWL